MDQPRVLPLLLLVRVWDVLAFHPRGFWEAVVLTAPGQPSCTLTQWQDPPACSPACAQSPPLPSFVQAPAVTLELALSLYLHLKNGNNATVQSDRHHREK